MLFLFIFVLTVSFQDFAAAQRHGQIEPESRDCGTLSRSRSAAPGKSHIFVVGGESAERDELPWQVAIYSKLFRPFMQICGGTVISASVVISAAHCFWDDARKQLPAENYTVAGGKLYRPYNDSNDENAQNSDISQIHIPPHFRGSITNYQDDIALLMLETPFNLSDSIKPVCIDFDYSFDVKHLTDGNRGKVAGWGLTSENGRPSPILQVVELPAVDIQRCFDNIEPVFLPGVTCDKLCAGDLYKGTAVCMGDSGGGLSFPETNSDGDTSYYLRGIVSTAPRSPTNENLCNIYTYATFTRINKHEHFIKEVMKQALQPALAGSLVSQGPSTKIPSAQRS